MTAPLTLTDDQILEAAARIYAENGREVRNRELAQALGTSLTWVSKQTRRLIREGRLTTPKLSRGGLSKPLGTHKRCPRCQTTLPIEDFGVRSPGRCQSWCKPCRKIYRREVYRLERKHEVTGSLSSSPPRVVVAPVRETPEIVERMEHMKRAKRLHILRGGTDAEAAPPSILALPIETLDALLSAAWRVRA